MEKGINFTFGRRMDTIPPKRVPRCPTPKVETSSPVTVTTPEVGKVDFVPTSDAEANFLSYVGLVRAGERPPIADFGIEITGYKFANVRAQDRILISGKAGEERFDIDVIVNGRGLGSHAPVYAALDRVNGCAGIRQAYEERKQAGLLPQEAQTCWFKIYNDEKKRNVQPEGL